MVTSVNASNGSTSGLISTGDASGILQLQTNNGTAALTLNTAQALGVGSGVSYGTSGQALISGGSAAAPSWGTLGTGAGGTGLTTVGSNGTFLQSNGTNLQWATPAAGAMTLISTQTVSGSSAITWTSISSYTSLYLIIEQATFNALSSSGNIMVQVGYGATPTYVTSGYTFGVNGSNQTNGNIVGGSWTFSQNGPSGFNLDGGYANSQATSPLAFNGDVLITDVSDTTANNYRGMFGRTFFPFGSSRSTSVIVLGNVTYSSASAITAIKITNTSGTLTGVFSLYGIT